MASVSSIILTLACCLCLIASVHAQSIVPSNSTNLQPISDHPYFNVNMTGSTNFPSFQIAPLGQYNKISRQYFERVVLTGRIVETTASNANQVRTVDISYISCDPEDYVNSNIYPADILFLIGNMRVSNSVVFYTRTANHCDALNWLNGELPNVNGVFTTVDPVAARQIFDLNFSRSSNAQARISADLNSYTNSSAPNWNGSDSSFAQGSTTPVAMIILYTITGIITALFIIIIVTGAVRAHRHPERYGPRIRGHGRGRQSRARGIARALLDTLPVIKFGDQQKSGNTAKEGDIEIAETSPNQKTAAVHVQQSGKDDVEASSSSPSPESATNADGSDEAGSLGCSICTEDFQKGQEVRVLPCNHKFHPDCVDPWLLNVSGTCPLCRIDLRNPTNDASTATTTADPQIAQPLASPANTSTVQTLRAAISGSREERLAALRRFRVERRSRNEQPEAHSEEDQRGLARRLTERFRIRTRRHDVVSGVVEGNVDQAEARFLATR